ncbi:MAG: histidine phosphatase family protein [Nostoc sp. NMS1]|uniref:histidine phosphatase family protein n=1 Tax=unclassified Nostoc TaxID=2593658 RepID=UPI0025EF3F83|nr:MULTISPECIES: histidine phosphatase family protein [unclassified Nostoc]MBN3909003.1 histidine phosphatase family protein [Nostoc sp. NMS1]MBN3991412.1 histidine phosphatase family protein [Nostoc sp. NMS2]
MLKTLYIVRHCQAVGQEPNAPLTSQGYFEAIALADLLFSFGIERVISSPFMRAYQSIAPLTERLGISIEIDNRLTERVLCATPLDDWRERLAESFTNLDLYLDGGESSRSAMARGIAVINEVLQQKTSITAIVTHGNLMALILKHFDDRIGYAEWEKLSNPDVYRIQFLNSATHVERMIF